jgi:hypothetical protein
MPESGLPIRVYKEHDMWHVDYGEGETEDHTSREQAEAAADAVAGFLKPTEGTITEIEKRQHQLVVNVEPDLPDVAAKIGIELRNEYVLGYRPKNAARDGKYRQVLVRLAKTIGFPPLKAMFRMGYYAPTQ